MEMYIRNCVVILKCKFGVVDYGDVGSVEVDKRYSMLEAIVKWSLVKARKDVTVLSQRLSSNEKYSDI